MNIQRIKCDQCGKEHPADPSEGWCSGTRRVISLSIPAVLNLMPISSKEIKFSNSFDLCNVNCLEAFIARLKSESEDQTRGDYDGLPSLIINVLKKMKLFTRQQIMEAIMDGTLHPRRWQCRNYGNNSHAQLCSWLGMAGTHKCKPKP